jgi:hypothetical protein
MRGRAASAHSHRICRSHLPLAFAARICHYIAATNPTIAAARIAKPILTAQGNADQGGNK